MKEPTALFRHRIFVGAKVGEAVHGKGEGLGNILRTGWLHGEVNAPRVMAVVRADQGFHLGVDLIASKHGSIGCRRVALPREPVLSVKTVLPTHRFSVFHHPARLLSDFSIERIHAIRRLLSNAGEEPRARREPTRMIVFHKAAVFHK